MAQMNIKSFSGLSSIVHLHGECITEWTGLEMALDGGRAVVTDDTVTSGFFGESPAVWAHPDVPFWQFSSIHIKLPSGLYLQLFAEDMDDRPNGLLMAKMDGMPEPVPEAPAGIFRSRALECLPVGQVALSVLREGPGGVVWDASLEISGQVVRLLAGEVYRRQGGTFDIVTPNESVLLQLNGACPHSAG
ncbi:hypothetical protein RBH89_08430 [Paracidovorax avenae]